MEPQLLERKVVLGLDPGSRRTGWGVIAAVGDRISHLGSGEIKLLGSAGDDDSGLANRLAQVHSELVKVLDSHRPTCAAVENVFVSGNPRSALILGQARGAILAALGARGLPVGWYAPTTVKLAVAGHGRADKKQVATMVRLQLGLHETPPEDVTDALATAICHARHDQTRVRVQVNTQTNTKPKTGVSR